MIFKPQRESAAPLDGRRARVLVAPQAGSPVHPNHLTALKLAFGQLAAGTTSPVVMNLRTSRDNRFDLAAVDHPQVDLFTIGDVIHLIDPIAWLAGIRWFSLPSSLGTFACLPWARWEYHAWSRKKR